MLTEIAFSLLDIKYVTLSSASFKCSASQIDMSAGKEEKRKAAGESKSERAMSQPFIQPRGHPEDAAAEALICHQDVVPADSSQVHRQLIPKPVLEYSPRPTRLHENTNIYSEMQLMLQYIQRS